PESGSGVGEGFRSCEKTPIPKAAVNKRLAKNIFIPVSFMCSHLVRVTLSGGSELTPKGVILTFFLGANALRRHSYYSTTSNWTNCDVTCCFGFASLSVTIIWRM